MRTKRNDKSSFFKNWTTAKLKKTASEYYDLIHGQNPCYGTKDILTLDGVSNELENRGIELRYKLTF